MYPLLDLAFQNASSCGLVKARCFEDMCCIDPIITPSSHDTVAIDLELEHGDLAVIILVAKRASRKTISNIRVSMFPRLYTYAAVGSRVYLVHPPHDVRRRWPLQSSRFPTSNMPHYARLRPNVAR